MTEKKHHLNVFERYVKAERLIVVRVESTSNRGGMLVKIIFCYPYHIRVGIALVMTHRTNSSRLTNV